jgi:succinate dehydrogenase/fumarate reductase flavoprotein subunit
MKTKRLQTDVVVVGGGMAGVCAAIAAARCGVQVVLVHDCCLLPTDSPLHPRQS